MNEQFEKKNFSLFALVLRFSLYVFGLVVFILIIFVLFFKFFPESVFIKLISEKKCCGWIEYMILPKLTNSEIPIVIENHNSSYREIKVQDNSQKRKKIDNIIFDLNERRPKGKKINTLKILVVNEPVKFNFSWKDGVNEVTYAGYEVSDSVGNTVTLSIYLNQENFERYFWESSQVETELERMFYLGLLSIDKSSVTDDELLLTSRGMVENTDTDNNGLLFNVEL